MSHATEKTIGTPALATGGALYPASFGPSGIVPETERERAPVPPVVKDPLSTDRGSLSSNKGEKTAAALIVEAGPPDEWSGGVAEVLGARNRERIRALWFALSGADKQRVLEAFVRSFEAEDVVLDLEDRYGEIAKRETEAVKAPLSAAAINRLPDAAFAVVLPGGEKDDEGKTVPRSLRKLPHHTAEVKDPSENTTIDLPRLRNALARLPQTDMPEDARTRATAHLTAHAKEVLPSSEAAQEKAEVDVSKPFPNEHAARQRPPGDFEPDSFRRSKLGFPDGIEAILGKPKGSDAMVIQTLRFDRAKWTPEKAKEWLRSHNFRSDLFEETSEKRGGLWGSASGKSRLAARVVRMMPKHKTYVEPFAGGAAVFYAKPKDASEREILNDLDPDIAFAFKFAQKATEEHVAALEKMDWVGSRAAMLRVDRMQPKNETERFYKVAFSRFAHFMRDPNGKGYDYGTEGRASTVPSRIMKVKERLQGVTIKCCDYAKVLSEYDSADTFFYLDPPYAGFKQGLHNEAQWDEAAFIAAIKRLKGKFIAHYDSKDGGALARFKQAGFHVQRISTTLTGHLGNKAGSLLEIRNFDCKTQKRILLAKRNPIGGWPDLCSVCKVEPAEVNVFWQDDLRISMPASLCLACLDVPEDAEPISKYVVALDMPILKLDEERRLVTGVVLEPDEVDAQEDTIDAEVIEAAAFNFLSRFGQTDGTRMGLMHRAFGDLGIELVESWIAREDVVLGGEPVKRGTWLMTVRVVSDALWAKVKRGELTGFSIGGVASIEDNRTV